MSVQPEETIIEPGRGMQNYWRDLWRYQELFYFLAWRDIAVRYKQTVIGIAWSVIRPLLTMLIFTVVFGRLAQMPTDGAPYPLLVLAALLPWTFFANALTESAQALIANANMLAKVYFPRLVLPTSAVIVALLDFAIAFGLLLALMLWYGILPTWRFSLLPVLLALNFMAALGPGLWLAALNVKYRDFRYIIPFIVQFGLYISPVGFSTSVVPEAWRGVYMLNPLVGIIEGFRWMVLGDATPLDLTSLGVTLVVSVLLLASGLYYFYKTERTFADVI